MLGSSPDAVQQELMMSLMRRMNPAVPRPFAIGMAGITNIRWTRQGTEKTLSVPYPAGMPPANRQ
ncbi:MAG: hypothetical protein V4772_14865 [Pseudomonadota bacterium]